MASPLQELMNSPYLRAKAMQKAPLRPKDADKKTRAQTISDLMSGTALATAFMPGVGDVAGMAADAAMYSAYPEQRNMLNYGLTALSALPLVPAVSAMRSAGNLADAAKTVDASYRGLHTAPSPRLGNTLNDLSEIYGDDIYSQNALRFFGMGDDYRKADLESLAAIRAAKGNPDAMVTVYRAAPPEAADINPGDWVALSKDYAQKHGESALGGKYKVISKKVRAADLATDGDALSEWGWSPKNDR